MIEANPSTPEPHLNHKEMLVREIEYHADQIDIAAIKLMKLLGTEQDDTQPLVIPGNGEYAGIIEAKPNGVKS